MLTDCNTCPRISHTEKQQQYIRKSTGVLIDHMCTKYHKRILHMARTRDHNPELKPCEKCIQEQQKEERMNDPNYVHRGRPRLSSKLR